jgi:hypothetical protein
MDPTVEDLNIRETVLRNLYGSEDITLELLFKSLAIIAAEFMRLDRPERSLDLIKELGYAGYFGDTSLKHRQGDPEFDARMRYLDSELTKRKLMDQIFPDDIRPTQSPGQA